MKYLKDRREWPPLAIYDIETTEWINVTLICHVDELGNRLSFDSMELYINWLFSNFSSTHVWAHFGGRFDHRFVLPQVKKRGWNFRVCMSGGSIVLMIVDNGEKKLHFCDSFRLMPNSLKSIGKTVGLKKLDVDRGKMEILTRAETEEYCFRDCEIALRGLQYMRDALESVNADFASTLASVASRWVRRSDAIDWKRLISEKSKSKGLDEFCEPAYFGGRTEMFKRGTFKGPIYYYDIVSSYPTSMLNELPLYFQNYVPAPRSNDKETIRRYLSRPGITEAYVDIPESVVTPLCVRYQGRLVFPYGSKIGREEQLSCPERCQQCFGPLRSYKCRGCGHEHAKSKWIAGRWTNIELLAALERGATVYPIVQARYEGASFLSEFVRTFYGLRKKAKTDKDAFRTYAYKILLNSLYGKLVETVDRVSYETDKPESRKGLAVSTTPVAGVYCVRSVQEGPFRHVAAGAYVTAYSRLRLLEGLEAALKAGGEVYYCDTDSIMTNVRLDEKMQGSELGQWNLEHVFEEVELVLPKVYRAKIKGGETIYRCKGMPMVREGDPDNLAELRWRAFKEYAETQDKEMGRLLGRSGLTGFVADVNAGTLDPRATELLRCLQGEDRKRFWNGSNSMPIQIGGKSDSNKN